MPCGGIYPIAASDYPCWACNKPGADHELIEWDSVIHGTCVRDFLKTVEGQIVVEHQHLIQIDNEVLQEEGKLNGALLAPRMDFNTTTSATMHFHSGEFTIDRATGEERCDECDPILKEDEE